MTNFDKINLFVATSVPNFAKVVSKMKSHILCMKYSFLSNEITGEGLWWIPKQRIFKIVWFDKKCFYSYCFGPNEFIRRRFCASVPLSTADVRICTNWFDIFSEGIICLLSVKHWFTTIFSREPSAEWDKPLRRCMDVCRGSGRFLAVRSIGRSVEMLGIWS